MSAGGRKPKLNDERHERLVRLIAAGNYASQAAEASGIGTRTYFRWVKRGEDADKLIQTYEEAVEHWNEISYAERVAHPELEPNGDDIPSENDYIYWQFWRDIKKAEAEAEAGAVLQIKSAAGDGTWQAAAWYLERKYKDRWGRTEIIKHEGEIDHRHQLIPPPDEMEDARKHLEEVRGQLTNTDAQLPKGSERSLEDDSQAQGEPETIDAEAEEIE